ncbi:MAG: hypothetical protein GEU28_11205 [Dehalococcoidia bacterium]|nr:hypothetical protein [Dehalococcoidia bacterium]
MRYPNATWKPITTNFRPGRAGGRRRAMAFVCHSQEGSRSLHALFSNPSRRASTHFWIGRDGAVEQYVDTADTAWGNGERNRAGGPDGRVPWAAAAYAAASLNDETISCELEGRAGEPMSSQQEAAAGALMRWVHVAHELGEPRRHVTVIEHNQLSATACPSGRWPIDRLIAAIGVAPRPSSAGVLGFWYPDYTYDSALAKFINDTIVNQLRQAGIGTPKAA